MYSVRGHFCSMFYGWPLSMQTVWIGLGGFTHFVVA